MTSQVRIFLERTVTAYACQWSRSQDIFDQDVHDEQKQRSWASVSIDRISKGEFSAGSGFIMFFFFIKKDIPFTMTRNQESPLQQSRVA
jgi:hypothetical protein